MPRPFSPDGARIVSGADDNTVRVWDASSGAELLVLRGHEGRARPSRGSCSHEGTAPAEPQSPTRARVCAAFSPDGAPDRERGR